MSTVITDNRNMNICLCGCGTTVKKEYARGHFNRAKSRTKEGLKICPRCKQAKPPTFEYWMRNKRGTDGLDAYCKICKNKKNKIWELANPEKVKKKNRIWSRNFRKNYPKKYMATVRKSQRKLRTEMINGYGGKCSCCGETILEFLTLEHTNGDGKQHRKRVGEGAAVWRDLRERNWPQNGFTLLCWNCHMVTKTGQVCPHKGIRNG